MAKKKAKKKSGAAAKTKAAKKGTIIDKSAVLPLAAIAVLIVAAGAFVLLQGSGNTGGSGTGIPTSSGIKTFKGSGAALELQGGKPVIRLFSTTTCPHCRWIKETFDSVAKQYVAEGKIVAYHWELETLTAADNTLTAEPETVFPESELNVFKQANPGLTVPTFVFGGKYTRIGNGYEASGDTANPQSDLSKQHLEQEKQEFIAVIEALIKEANAQ
ncbi:MAG: hypothetical protein NTW59_00395 [Candidatus Diapherotrites archaeon]|nr:hypothetical protein [Candidatus Diapherotrites archaeon]